MGCQASSNAHGHKTIGGETSPAPHIKVNIRHLRLKKCGVRSVDLFVDQVEDTVERFAKLTDDIERKRVRFEQVAGFDVYHHQQQITLRHPLVGVLLQNYSAANGDMSKVKVEFKEKKPFIKVSLNGVSVDDAEKQIEALEDYLDEISDCIEEKLPKLLHEMSLLVDRVGLLQANAGDELAALNFVEKSTAITRIVSIISDVPKVHNLMKQGIKDVEDELSMIKEVQYELQKEGELKRLASDGKHCHEAKKFKPVECYVHIFGSLTSKERIELLKEGVVADPFDDYQDHNHATEEDQSATHKRLPHDTSLSLMVLKKAMPKLIYFQGQPPKVEDLDQLFSQAVDQIWDQFETSGNGSLSRQETKNFVRQVMAQNGIQGDINQTESEAVFNEMDTNSNGTISRAEMRNFLKRLVVQTGMAL